MRIDCLETPALLVDRDAFDRNMERMRLMLEKSGAALRPHYKSHKSAAIAHLQIEAGAKGICCAKVSEAEDLALAGIEDILIANQVVEKSRIARLAWLAKGCRMTVCADQAQNIRDLEQAAALEGSRIHCLVEYEVGMGRCGVETPEEFAALARQIMECPHLEFDGIQAYAGHLSHEPDGEIRRRESEKIEARLRQLLDYLKGENIPVKEVSGASTATAVLRGADTVYTEVQAGSYLFMDGAYGRMGLEFEQSLTMLATVVSVRPDLVVTDAGVKCMGADHGEILCPQLPGAAVNLSEEHSAFTFPGHGLQPGDKVRLIPGHCCTTMNLNDFFYFVREERILDRLPVTSRGKSR